MTDLLIFARALIMTGAATYQGITYTRRRGPAIKRGASEQRVLTPRRLVEWARQELMGGRPLFDLSADAESTVGERWFGPGGEMESALHGWSLWATHIPQGWAGWCNPPFDRASEWARRCSESRHWLHSCLLVPDTSSKWMREYVWPRAMVYRIGRVRFVGHPTQFPKDLVIAHFGPDVKPGVKFVDLPPETRGLR